MTRRRDSEAQLDAVARALRHTWYDLRAAMLGAEHDEGPLRQGFWALGVLAAGPKRMSELAEATGTSQASLTGIIDRLERRGYVTRSRSDEDRRVVTVELTDRGRATVDSMHDAMFARLGSMLEPLTAAERSELVRLLGKLSEPKET